MIISTTILNNHPFISLIRHNPDLVAYLDQDGVILVVNPALEDFLGSSSEKLHGQPITILFDQLHLDVLVGKPISTLIKNLPIIDLEYRCKHRDNSYRDVLWSFFPIINNNEILEGLLLVGSDITTLKELSQQVERLDNIIKYAPDWIYWKDRNSIHLGSNNQFSIAAGFENREDIIGKSDSELPWRQNAVKYNRDDQEVIESGEPKLNIEDVVPLKDGKSAIVISNKVPLRDATGQVIGVLGIATDITERKKTEEDLRKSKEAAEAANKAKTEFLENMRHDIRTPLSGIIGFADILKQASDNPIIKEYAETLVVSSHALLDFLNEILETIQMTSGEIPLLKKKFNLKKKLDDIISLNQSKAKQKNLDLQLEYDTTFPQYLIGDPKRLQRIVLELVANALNFTNKGQIKVAAKMVKKQDNNIIAEITVIDTGIGIPVEKQQEIFTRFKRLSPSYEGIYKGAGLGLAVVKQFIDDLDAEIYVDSQTGSGSTFTCLVPLRASLLDNAFGANRAEALTVEHSTSNQAFLPVDLKSSDMASAENLSHILLVEDSSIAQKILTHMLIGLNCQIDVASDGTTALQLTSQKHYDLIFMDLGLPSMDGYEITKRIRLQEKGHHVPIIALSAHVDSKNKQKCIEVGMMAIYSKPLMKDTVYDILNAFIPNRAF